MFHIKGIELSFDCGAGARALTIFVFVGDTDWGVNGLTGVTSLCSLRAAIIVLHLENMFCCCP